MSNLQRQPYYGEGRQPLDDIIELGWGPAFCAGNVLKYLRRNKHTDQMKDIDKARWYASLMLEKARSDEWDGDWAEAWQVLLSCLDYHESKRLNVLAE